MNDSFFKALKKAEYVIDGIEKLMCTKLSEKIGTKARMLQLFLWSIVSSVMSAPVAHGCLYLVDLAGVNSVAGTFWMIVGILAILVGFASVIFLLFFLLIFLLYVIFLPASK